MRYGIRHQVFVVNPRTRCAWYLVVIGRSLLPLKSPALCLTSTHEQSADVVPSPLVFERPGTRDVAAGSLASLFFLSWDLSTASTTLLTVCLCVLPLPAGSVPRPRECGLALDLGESELMLLETLSGAKPSLEAADDRRPSYGGGDEGEREEGEDEGEEEESEAAKFCTAWLLCVGSGTVGCLLAKVCR